MNYKKSILIKQMNNLPEELIRKIYMNVYDYVIKELNEKNTERELEEQLNNEFRDCGNNGCYSTCSIGSSFCSEYCEAEYLNNYYIYQELNYNSYYD